ncbi:MAG: hypothetical protein MI807_20170 [Verrucomicrobiales bacterium]|nr:hypothetical protein [Verrucomicrobiales bacterium]
MVAYTCRKFIISILFRMRIWILFGVFVGICYSIAKYRGTQIVEFVSQAVPINLSEITPGIASKQSPEVFEPVEKITIKEASNRDWTFSDGSKLKASLIAADQEKVQLRVSSTQGLGVVELGSFAEPDRNFIMSLINSQGKSSIGYPVPLKKHPWPRSWRDTEPNQAVRIGSTNRWRSPNFQITNQVKISEESLQAIVRICESVDGALKSLPIPLPVNWGRPDDELRTIVVQSAEGVETNNLAGFWDSRTGHVHIYAEYLLEPDRQSVVFEFDKPEKVQKYDVIVHEVTHQSTAALAYLNTPAWVVEGIAEYMSATQYAPAAYQFTATHVTVRHHINKRLLSDRIVKKRRMNLVHLEKFMNRSILEWNHIGVDDQVAGYLQYNAALLLTDYFIHRDHPNGAYFRRYLECILSGIPESVAREKYLMRGRTYRELEQEMHDLWEPIGFEIAFQNRSELLPGDVTIDHSAESIKRSIAAQRSIQNRVKEQKN